MQESSEEWRRGRQARWSQETGLNVVAMGHRWAGFNKLGNRRGRAGFTLQFLVDAIIWIASIYFAHGLRVEFQPTFMPFTSLLVLGLVAAGLQFLVGWWLHLYRGRHPLGSFGEVQPLLLTIATVGLLLWLGVLAFGNLFGLSRSVPLIALPLVFVLTGAVRYLRRVAEERAIQYVGDVENAIIFGAGWLGAQMVRRMRLDPRSPYRPVALLDDNPDLRYRELDSVRVQGALDELPLVAERFNARALIVTIGRADAALLHRVDDVASRAGLKVLVLPPLAEVLEGRSGPGDLRELTIGDIIGRHPVDTQVASIAGYLAGKRVAVTGAGGSIGSELCRQIAGFEPSEIIMLDHDETALQDVQLSLVGHGLLDSDDVVLVDIRDERSVSSVFEARRPEVVFHAAALKHLPLLEQYPAEAWKTNVLGTLNVLRSAMAVGVETFINISTDKAANPTSVLGKSKRAAERLTAWAGEQTGRPYVSVRFGNVLGSRGSMLPLFTAMIEAGGPLTVTHPDVTRFFMTIPEACQLVIQAGAIGDPGEVLILDMGQAVRILDVAERMIAMSGSEIEIVFTGLRPGEKLHEELVSEGEVDIRRQHPKIAHSAVPSLHPDSLTTPEWLSGAQTAARSGTAPSEMQT